MKAISMRPRVLKKSWFESEFKDCVEYTIPGRISKEIK